jgi:hypothetical protein
VSQARADTNFFDYLKERKQIARARQEEVQLQA